MMRILTYKRTHTGDPNYSGMFGIHDCMERVRNMKFDAVIGIGSKKPWSNSKSIAGRITWIGINPIKRIVKNNFRGNIVLFEKFILLDSKGPIFEKLAPLVATRFYDGGARYILDGYLKEEYNEVFTIIQKFDSLLSKNKVKKYKYFRSFYF